MNKQNKSPAVVAGESGSVPSEQTLPMAWVKMTHKSPDHMAARYLYAAYGSNLALEQMTRRCPGADIVGGGLLRNARLVFAKYLGIVADDSATVPIGVFKVTAADIVALDRYEGLGRSYDRILITVECKGVAVRCFTYLKRDNAPREPSETYYATCLAGYNDWQFDSRRLRHARDHARKTQKPLPPASATRDARPYWYDKVTQAYRSDEPVGGGTAAEYIANLRTADRRNRPPRPEGGRLGGADYVRPRIDERASLTEFKRAIESGRVPTQTGFPGAVDGATATGRDGQKWIATRGRDGHLTWKRQGD